MSERAFSPPSPPRARAHGILVLDDEPGIRLVVQTALAGIVRPDGRRRSDRGPRVACRERRRLARPPNPDGSGSPRSRTRAIRRPAALALDRLDPESYAGPPYKRMNAHPAKARVAKPRVLASSAAPGIRRRDGPQDRRAARMVSSAVVLSTDPSFARPRAERDQQARRRHHPAEEGRPACPSRPTTRPTPRGSGRPARSSSRRKRLRSCVRASRPRAGPTRRPSQISPRGYSSRSFGRSRATGPRSTTGVRRKRD